MSASSASGNPIALPEAKRRQIEKAIVDRALANAKKSANSTGRGNGLIITGGADPPVIPADGKSCAHIVARVTDASGRPMAGKEVQFSASGGWLGPLWMVTDEQGSARALLTSDREPRRVKVKAKVNPEGEADVLFASSTGADGRRHDIEILSLQGNGDVITLTYRTDVQCPYTA